jgi:hypothetical protein
MLSEMSKFHSLSCSFDDSNVRGNEITNTCIVSPSNLACWGPVQVGMHTVCTFARLSLGGEGCKIVWRSVATYMPSCACIRSQSQLRLTADCHMQPQLRLAAACHSQSHLRLTAACGSQSKLRMRAPLTEPAPAPPRIRLPKPVPAPH